MTEFEQAFTDILDNVQKQLPAPTAPQMLPTVEANLQSDAADLVKLSTEMEAFILRVLGEEPPAAPIYQPEPAASLLGRITNLQDVMRSAIIRLQISVERATAIG